MSGDEFWSLRNEKTGEIGLLDPGAIVPRRARRGLRKHPYHRAGRFAWYVVNSDDYAAVLRSLRGASIHVFAALPMLMVKDNMLLCKQTDICAATALGRSAVSGAMVEMRRQLIVGELQGVLRFSPEIAWKGYIEDLEHVRKLWRGAKVGWIKERRAAM